MVMIIYGQESRDRKTGKHSRTAGPGRMYRKGFKFIFPVGKPPYSVQFA